MINYFEQENWENLKAHGSKKYKGESFTGIIEDINAENNSRYRKSYASGIDHGYSVLSSFKESQLYFAIYIYIYGINRFQLGFRISKEIYWCQYCWCYDSLSSLNDFTINNRDNKQKEEGFKEMFINHNDLDYEKLIANNQDVIDIYEDNKKDIIDLDTFVYACGGAESERFSKVITAYLIQENMTEYLGQVVKDTFTEKFVWQEEQIQKIIRNDELPETIQYIGGVSVAFHDITQKIVAVITVMDVYSQTIVDNAIYTKEKVSMHIPDVFAFNEAPWAIQAFEKLKMKPQLIFCDGHGIEHIKNMGLATFLGIELNIPTIGCAKKRMVGYYEKENLEHTRGSQLDLIHNGEVVGKSLRTQENENPVYVSLGHKISLETSVDWVLQTTTTTRIPMVVEEAVKITKQLMPESIRFDFLNDEPNKYGILI